VIADGVQPGAAVQLRGKPVRSRRPNVSFRIDLHVALVCALAFVALLLVLVLSVLLGDFSVPFGDAIRNAVGIESGSSYFVVHELRLPRALTGMMVGAAFGVAGAIFQSIARNPLASPDVIGVNAGASAVAVLVIVLWNGSTTLVSLGALVGGLVTAAIVYALAWRNGLSGYRLVLVGIGIGSVLLGVTAFLLTRTDLNTAQRATVWLTGSLNGRGWEHAGPVAITLAVLLPATCALGRKMHILELGDEAARGLGLDVERSRALLVLAAVTLASVGTASARRSPVVWRAPRVRRCCPRRSSAR
jgi:iron complex transport system permease protein